MIIAMERNTLKSLFLLLSYMPYDFYPRIIYTKIFQVIWDAALCMSQKLDFH